MTDRLPPLSTPIAPPSQPTFSLLSAAQDVARKQETVEEEPYTIKCICNFTGDDGNTIFCETCETWQHIECYYPYNVEDALRDDFAHSCAECEPRSLNRQHAIQLQRVKAAVPAVQEAADKKPKRPPTKSQKKKPKPSELQINGLSSGAPEHTKHLSPHDGPPLPKKAKNAHKTSQSISSQAPKRSPSYGTAKSAPGHPLSPANTPPDLPDDFEIHNYSSGFLSLYNDQAVQIVNTNSFADLQVSNAMSSWLRDPEKLQKETGCSYDEVFQKLPDIDSIKVKLEVEHTKKAVSSDTVLQWQYLRAASPIDKDVPLIEVNGQIGFQATYCSNPENRWDEFTAPLPFVLFHPMLPLYIDTRREGSEARFVRHSCRPNATLETYLSAGSEYHFWLVSDRPIAAKEQITIPWDFRFPNDKKTRMLRALGLGDDAAGTQPEPSLDDIGYRELATWLHLVLSEHGGCACDLGTECAFARFHRTYIGKIHQRPNPPKGKKRKPKAQHAISPTSTGHATNSRAPSEGHLEDVPEHDGRSVSSSSRSKPPSRDMTPTARQGSFDTLGILTEPTDRDKRKVAMVEDSFRRMEQQQQPQRKRKRASDGTANAQSKASKPSSASQTPNLRGAERSYIDAGTGTSRSKSGSPSGVSPTHASRPTKTSGSSTGSAPARSQPTAARKRSIAPHADYRDVAVQTDPPEASETPAPKRRVGSCLRKRLLEHWHQLRLEVEEGVKRPVGEQPPVDAVNAADGTTEGDALSSSPVSTREPEAGSATGPPTTVIGSKDIPMTDAPPISPQSSTVIGTSSTATTTTSMTTTTTTTTSPIKHNRSPELRVQMPPVPAFGSPTSAGPSSASATTPVSASGSILQSPFSGTFPNSPFAPPSVNGVAALANPSPVKKKLSLSDYKNRMNKAAAAAAGSGSGPSRPSVSTGAHLLKPVPSGFEDPRSATSLDGVSATTAGSSPTTEIADKSAGGNATTPATTSSVTHGPV